GASTSGDNSNASTPLSSGNTSRGGAANGGTNAGGTPMSGGDTSRGGATNGGTNAGGTVIVTSGGSAAGGTAPASGGTTSTSGSTGCAGSSFQLSWQDDFDNLNTSRWQFMTHTLGVSQFTATNAQVSGGMATLSLTDSPSGSAMPFQGVEMRSKETITYGKVESRIRFAKGSGVISALVLIYTPWPPPDWNELDIEFLGKSTNQVQFNTMINIPPADPQTGHLQYPKVVTLGFDATSEFHTYAVEWVPGSARFLVDGVVQYTATEQMSRMVLPQNILLTIWASDSASWAGATNDATAPTTVQYDWVRVCRYVGA
ncbi:MAG TPA: family 16 glycosylhydrolase, partial [Polyangiaceae bacterium]